MFKESDVDYHDLSSIDKELMLEGLIEEFFGGVDKDDIIELLQEKYPDNF